PGPAAADAADEGDGDGAGARTGVAAPPLHPTTIATGKERAAAPRREARRRMSLFHRAPAGDAELPVALQFAAARGAMHDSEVLTAVRTERNLSSCRERTLAVGTVLSFFADRDWLDHAPSRLRRRHHAVGIARRRRAGAAAVRHSACD